MILFRKKYPRWWFDWNRELLRFANRVRDLLRAAQRRVPLDGRAAVRSHLEIEYPNAETDLARGMPLVKWFLAIPHYVVLFFLDIAAFFVVIYRLVRDPVHRSLPALGLRLRRRGVSLEQPGHGVRLHPGHRQVPAVLAAGGDGLEFDRHAGRVTQWPWCSCITA